MLLSELEHIIRAAADTAGEKDIVVVGSQAILATVPDASGVLSASIEADVYPRDRPDAAVEIAGTLGEDSRFHETFGFYADGVGPETSEAPPGWEERLIPITNENTRTPSGMLAVGWCMEAYDLVLAKLVAGRDKDLLFGEAAIKQGVVDHNSGASPVF